MDNEMFLKKSDEFEDQYIYRICEMKDVIGKWEDVAHIINENLSYNRDESAYRKRYQDFKKIFNNIYQDKIDEDITIQRMEKLKESIQNERYKLQATKIEKSRYDRQDARWELFIENLVAAKDRLKIPKFYSLPNQYEKNSDMYEWVVCSGDYHYGAKFDVDNNSYSTKIFEERLQDALLQLIDFVKREHICYLKFLNAGDTIQGLLRINDLKLNEVPVVDAIFKVPHLIANFLNELSAYCYVDYYHCPLANHTQIRPLGSKANELQDEDVERIISRWIADLLKDNERVQVFSNDQDNSIDFKIFDFEAVLSHGHETKEPFQLVKDYSVKKNKIYDYVFIGHRHTSEERIVSDCEYYNREVIQCPSLVGRDPYSDSKGLGAQPMIRACGFHRKYGHKKNENFFLK